MNNKDISSTWETIKKLRSEGKLSIPIQQDIENEPTALAFTYNDSEPKKDGLKINGLHIIDNLEIIKYTGINCKEIESWSNEIKSSPVLEPTDDNPTGRYLQFKYTTIKVGDFIIKDANGNISVFNLTGIDLSFKERKILMDIHCKENNLLPIGVKVPFNAQSIKDYFKVCDKYKIPSKMYILVYNNKVIRLYN
jgi:hypothetical protein